MLNLKWPEVKRFHRAAEAHLEAARALRDACPEKSSSTLAHEAIYLSGYVVECGLKSLLLTQHPLRKHEEIVAWFKSDLKHDLEKLKNELGKKGVELPREHKENLNRVRSQWTSEMRYTIRRRDREDADRVYTAAEDLFGWITGS